MSDRTHFAKFTDLTPTILDLGSQLLEGKLTDSQYCDQFRDFILANGWSMEAFNEELSRQGGLPLAPGQEALA